MKAIWSWTLDPHHETFQRAGKRADVLLLEALEARLGEWSPSEAAETERTYTRSQLQKLISEGQVTINGEPIKSNFKLRGGAKIQIVFPEPKSTELIPEDRPLDILYEDSHLLVVNKPQGLTVHPSATQTDNTLVHALLHHVKDLSGIGGVLRPGIVHRIDKNTSGALVITKTDAVHQALAQVFAKHAIERSYWALCYGAPTQAKFGQEFKVTSQIGRNPDDRKKMSMNVRDGRLAITHLRGLEKYQIKDKPFASLVEARLETGRTHQVRVHLTGSGHSILGDPVYGVPSERHPKWLALPPEVQERVLSLPGQALHARVLGFEHPITGQKLRFEAEPPELFQALLEQLRRYKK